MFCFILYLSFSSIFSIMFHIIQSKNNMLEKILLKNISRISPKYQKILTKMEIFSVEDLLRHFPFRYEDFRKIVLLSPEYIGENVTLEGKVIKTRLNRIFKKRMTITEVFVQDKAGNSFKAVWFNQPFILENLPEGVFARFSGKLEKENRIFNLKNPVWEKTARENTHTGCLVPIYPETSGITSRWIRWQIKSLLPLAKNIPDILTKEIQDKYNLYDLSTAFSQIHFPESWEKMIRARKRFAFEEIFLIQMKAIQTKKKWEREKSNRIKFDLQLIKKFLRELPFTLTDAQKKSSFEILKDLEKSKPMNRLLNGDVGSGKTVVSAIAILQTIYVGFQTALMAPTEVLARQHFETFVNFFQKYSFNIALLTSSEKKISFLKSSSSPFQNNFPKTDPSIRVEKKVTREEILSQIKNGQIHLIIGTHALIQKDAQFKNLSLVIVDEQHRFGVAQRAQLQEKAALSDDTDQKTAPHFLSMTATPIPRTLAIAFFGSLDISILDEMPKNRKPIETKIVPPEKRVAVYDFIRCQIKSGRQVFIIFPLIEESQKIFEVKAAVAEHKRLSEEIFPEFNLGLMHGKLKPREKENVMKKFKENFFQILVSTSVVEVGVDIPNATIMIIENAERFGLTQLHQFRGRIGRGNFMSFCFLFCQKVSSRLKVLEKTTDGFKIAEKDLKLRGPGQFFGSLQSGIPDIAMENLNNLKLIHFARAEAQHILQKDPELKNHLEIKKAIEKFARDIHLE